jgi:hypothetical protein
LTLERLEDSIPQVVQAQLGFHIITVCQPPLLHPYVVLLLLPLYRLPEENNTVDVVVVVMVLVSILIYKNLI